MLVNAVEKLKHGLGDWVCAGVCVSELVIQMGLTGKSRRGIIATLVCGWTQNICGKKTGYLEGGLESTDLAQNKMKSCR